MDDAICQRNTRDLQTGNLTNLQALTAKKEMMRSINRQEAIEAIDALSGLTEFDKSILITLDKDVFNYSDQSLAIRWFLLFGELVSVNGESIQHLLGADLAKSELSAAEIIKKIRCL